MAKFNDSLI